MRTPWFPCLPIGMLLLLGAAPAIAQQAQESSQLEPSVVPPRLLEDPGVRYPQTALDEGYHERVELLLILELDATGRVIDAEVERPAGRGFDEEALEAARRLRFEPALQAGVPSAARIKFRYTFEPPPATLVGAVTDARRGEPVAGARVRIRIRLKGVERVVRTGPSGSFEIGNLPSGPAGIAVEAQGHVRQSTEVTLVLGKETSAAFRLERENAPSAPPAQAPIEISVSGEPLPPAVSSYTRDEVRKIPGAFGDPFRAIETLPGVTPVASGLPYFYVRGAPPGNVGYFIDGVRVPYLYHIGFGPSVIGPALVDRVDLYPGGYPAKLGRFAGGVVTASTTEPMPALHGEANLRLFDIGGLVESGFGGGRGTALLGGRYSYSATLLSLFAPEIKLDYRDYQARLSYELTPNDRVSVFSFGSYDLLGRVKNDILEILFGTEFYRADIRYDHRFSSGRLRTAVTLGYDRTSAALLSGERRNVVNRSIAMRSEVVKHLSRKLMLRGGTDISLDAYQVDAARYGDPDHPETQSFEEQFRPRTDLASGAWLDLTFRTLTNLEVTPGLRADIYRSGSASAAGVEPRLAARWSIAPSLRLMPATGLVHQPPSFALPIPGLTPSLNQGLQRGIQNSLAVELDLDDAVTAGVTPFYNAYYDMTDALGTSSGNGPPDFESRSDGRSYGLEVFLRRRLTRRLGGFFTYTLSRAERSVRGKTFPSSFDRSHVLNLAASYGLGRAWTAGSRFVFYSGAPAQETAGGAMVSRSANASREPPFFRLDLRLEKRWTLTEATWLAFVAEVMNATLSKETFAGEEVGPIVIPSVGIEAGF